MNHFSGDEKENFTVTVFKKSLIVFDPIGLCSISFVFKGRLITDIDVSGGIIDESVVPHITEIQQELLESYGYELYEDYF